MRSTEGDEDMKWMRIVKESKADGAEMSSKDYRKML